jgi:hypothetical protein
MEKEIIEHAATGRKATFYVGCKQCEQAKAAFLETGSVPFGPGHEPTRYSCVQSKRTHCTCDSCF